MLDQPIDLLFSMDGCSVLAVDEHEGVVNVLVGLARVEAR